MPRSVMLGAVHRDRPFLGDAGADAIGALGRLRPHTAEPSSPIAEAARIGLVAAVLDGDTLWSQNSRVYDASRTTL